MNTRLTTLDLGGWLLLFIMAGMFSIMSAMALTWISIGSNDIAYSIQKMQNQAEAARAHVAKLEVERDSLLSPYVLGKTAEQLGMSMADPGQIRRLEASRKK
ncbi:MAG: hypothetical protein IKJ34_03210 [Mailhella sp.]|nr:hypothetical protein [Mailhella sp.]